VAGRTSPFKGLRPFDDVEADVDFFFGRDRDREIIVANLMASRLTVLYGETGVGKSSVLRAGVAHHLRGAARSVSDVGGRAGVAVAVLDSWQDDPVAALSDTVADSVREALGHDVDLPIAPDSLAHRLEAWTELLDGDLYVILDQAEEFFLYHEADESGERFISEFADAVRLPGLRANFILSLREDSVAKLDRFRAQIPNVLANYIRLDYLDRESGREAIVGPIRRYNELLADQPPVEIEPDLVEVVLDQVTTGRVELGRVGRGTVDGSDGDGRIETPFLQLVMQRLWEHDIGSGSNILRRSTLEELGGAEQIVRDHLDRAMAALSPRQKEVAASVFNHLVTPSGTKIAHAVPDLARYAGVEAAELSPVVSTLEQQRIVRPVAADNGVSRVEIYHDVLGDAVLDWRTAHETERRLDDERRSAARRHRRLLGLLVVAAGLLAVMAGVTVFALTQRQEARSQRQEARSQARKAHARELDTAAVSLLDADPALSLLLASEAARLAPGPDAEQTLRQAYILSRERRILSAPGGVSASSYSPDGRRIVVAGAGDARVFDAKTGKELLDLHHGSSILAAAFSPDGRRVVTGGQDGIARVWAADTGARVGAFRHGAPIRAVAIDPGGALLVTAGGREGKLWRIGHGLVATLPWRKPVTSVVFDPLGGLVALTGNDVSARLYSTMSGKLVRALDQGGRVTSASFAPDGERFVTTGLNDEARIWRVRDGMLLHELKMDAAVLDAAFSPGGSRVATVGADGIGRIWNASTGMLIASILGHKGIVETVSFSPDGNFVVTGSTDRTARVSKADNGDGRAVLAGHRDSVHTVAFSPDGKTVLTASNDGTARLWDPVVQPQLRLVHRIGARIGGATYVGSGGRILVAGPGWTALVLNARDGHVVRTLRARGPVRAVAASPDGKLLAVAGGRVVRLVRPRGKAVEIVDPTRMTAVAIAPDRRWVVTGDVRGRGRIWSASGRPLVSLNGHTGEITDVAVSADGRYVATASADRTARVWDAVTGAPLHRLEGHRDRVTSVVFSPEGRYVLTASRDHDARLWNAVTGAPVQVLRFHFGEVADASFSPDGRWILTAGPAAAGLWKPGVDGPILPYGFGGHKAPLQSAVFDPTGRYVLTSSLDGTVRRAFCDVCAGLGELRAKVGAQLAGSGRRLTDEERERFGLG
jgi:WD40 repeat protein